jgi:hypothetical protein
LVFLALVGFRFAAALLFAFFVLMTPSLRAEGT